VYVQLITVFSSEKLYFNIQAICDHTKQFISYDMGWPGSMTDVTILKNSYLWNNRQTFFSGDQYLLADCGMVFFSAKIQWLPKLPQYLRILQRFVYCTSMSESITTNLFVSKTILSWLSITIKIM
jgi:hypothetical protein